MCLKSIEGGQRGTTVIGCRDAGGEWSLGKHSAHECCWDKVRGTNMEVPTPISGFAKVHSGMFAGIIYIGLNPILLD